MRNRRRSGWHIRQPVPVADHSLATMALGLLGGALIFGLGLALLALLNH